MINNLWKDTKIYCSCHDEPVEMVLTPTKGGYEYACQNKSCGCKNFISLKDFEKMIDYLSDTLCNAEAGGDVLNLTNYTWKTKFLTFKIVEHSNIYKIEVLNKKAFA
jgi:hypothetical protein